MLKLWVSKGRLSCFNGSVNLTKPAPVAWKPGQITQLRQCSSSLPCASESPTLPIVETLERESHITIPNRLPDHRTIATSQSIFFTNPASPGSPIFLPGGARIFNKLVLFLRAQYALYGYEEVLSPTIYKRSLWEQSGHWDNYKDYMFEVSGNGATGSKSANAKDVGEDEEYGLKPMNCPGHCLIFKSSHKSYRDLPVRYADFSPLHRNEMSGTLSGLTRVRRFHQDDAHIFCRPSQIASEITSTLQFIDVVYRVFKLPSYKLLLSTRPDKHIGTAGEWDRAEAALKQALTLSGKEWSTNEGDGAFYGPKIDVILKDSDGKEHQTATIQLDFQLPARFELEYLAPAPEAEKKGFESTDPQELKDIGLVRPVIIHRAILGSLERFMALLLEHHGGRWPFWISPRQAIVIPVATTEALLSYTKKVQRIISGLDLADSMPGNRDADFVDADGQATFTSRSRPIPLGRRTFVIDIDDNVRNSLSKKIREARTKQYNHIIVVGEKNMSENTATIRSWSTDGENPGYSNGEDVALKELYHRFVKLEDQYL